MFWTGNYIAERELGALLKEPNVSLKQVLEADDVLQECKVDNKSLIQFITRPEILDKLVTLITEEPPPNTELINQYRHASIACEVLTSHLSTLADRLSSDTALMHRLCDFLNREPPLNPLLASFFSKTIEMLLQRNPKQDWYLYHIVCLRVLDFFRSRADFLPNLLRHMSTSAITNIFKYFICLDDLFSKAVIEWLDEYQFVESVIQIVCGSYEPPAPPATPADSMAECSMVGGDGLERSHDGDLAHDEDAQLNCTNSVQGRSEVRLAGVASVSAAELLADVVLHVAANDTTDFRGTTTTWLVSRLQSPEGAGALLRGMFTAPPHLRETALSSGTHVLLALLNQDPIISDQNDEHRTAVELSIAPHLPLLHQALLEPYNREGVSCVGRGRLSVARLVGVLCGSRAADVGDTLLTLGTPPLLVNMFFQHPHHSLLHHEVVHMVHTIADNHLYRDRYLQQLLVEHDLLTRLMDAYEDNEARKSSGAGAAGYGGHLMLLVRRIWGEELHTRVSLAPEVLDRWTRFYQDTVAPLIDRLDKPLGGYFVMEQKSDDYVLGLMVDTADYEYNDLPETTGDGLVSDQGGDFTQSQNMDKFDEMLQTSYNIVIDPDNWKIDQSPWSDSCESGAESRGADGAESGWADFSDVFAAPLDPYAAHGTVDQMEKQLQLVTSDLSNLGFDMSRGGGSAAGAAEGGLDETALTNNLLTAISGMDPEDIANLVNANCQHPNHIDSCHETGATGDDCQLGDAPDDNCQLSDKTPESKLGNLSSATDTVTADTKPTNARESNPSVVLTHRTSEDVKPVSESGSIGNVIDNTVNVTDNISNENDNTGNINDNAVNVMENIGNANNTGNINDSTGNVNDNAVNVTENIDNTNNTGNVNDNNVNVTDITGKATVPKSDETASNSESARCAAGGSGGRGERR